MILLWKNSTKIWNVWGNLNHFVDTWKTWKNEILGRESILWLWEIGEECGNQGGEGPAWKWSLKHKLSPGQEYQVYMGVDLKPLELLRN